MPTSDLVHEFDAIGDGLQLLQDRCGHYFDRLGGVDRDEFAAALEELQHGRGVFVENVQPVLDDVAAVIHAAGPREQAPRQFLVRDIEKYGSVDGEVRAGGMQLHELCLLDRAREAVQDVAALGRSAAYRLAQDLLHQVARNQVAVVDVLGGFLALRCLAQHVLAQQLTTGDVGYAEVFRQANRLRSLARARSSDEQHAHVVSPLPADQPVMASCHRTVSGWLLDSRQGRMRQATQCRGQRAR